jgi:hypothetical protein
LKITISITLFLVLYLASCDTDLSQKTTEYYNDSIMIENTSENDMFILANDWIVLGDSSLNNRDQFNIWSTNFISNKLHFSKFEHKFQKINIPGCYLESILSSVPLFYRIKPKGNFKIYISLNTKYIKNDLNYLNYHICYYNDINILDSLSEYNIRNSKSLSLEFDTNIFRFSKCLDTISIEDQELLESSEHLDIIESKLIRSFKEIGK